MLAIVVQTFIAAPAESVWVPLVSSPDILLDALPARAWPEEGREEQAPRHLAVRWPFTEPAGAATTVRLTLHDVGGGVRLDLRHEGWGEGPRWEELVQGHFAGWLQGLAAFGHFIETGNDPRAKDPELKDGERYFISGEIPAASGAIYRSLTDPDVIERWSDGELSGARIVEQIEDRFLRWRLAAGGSELVAILRPTPRGTHVALAVYGVKGRGASQRWPGLFEKLTKYLG